MYGVPADMDLSAFSGATLTSIILGAVQITFDFQDHGWISVQGTWALTDTTDDVVDRSLGWNQDVREREVYRVHVLMGLKVVSTSVEPPTSISLTFEDGYTLRIVDDTEYYESFQIDTVDGGGYIV